MRKRLAGFLLASALAACGPKTGSTFVKVDDVALGRVVVYRNGVAYYERRATVQGGFLTVSVPRDRVDDFLKSLTVVDAISKQPLPVSIPREQAHDGAYLVMKLQLPSKDKADVVLTYVTEAPAWKPSYRVVVGDKGKVMLEGWAIVDNTSGEDWKGVLVGVGSSSALSFRYDLWSVRQVQRETLADAERFAVAPPTGISPYGGGQNDASGGEVMIGELGDDEIRRPEGHPDNKRSERVAVKDSSDEDEESVQSESDKPRDYRPGKAAKRTSRRPVATGPAPAPRMDAPMHPTTTLGHATRGGVGSVGTGGNYDARVSQGDQKMKALAQSLVRSNKTIVVEGYADSARGGDPQRRANDRANIVRNQLIDQGVPPARIKVVTKLAANQPERVRLVAQAPSPEEQKVQQAGKAAAELTAQPVGESHFASPTPMTVEKGASAMVSMVRKETDGEVVYLYDAESDRGNANFAFRAVRFTNPTTSTLETGPVTVYGNERFIGEGLTEPIPPKASAVVPYALDRQIVVERNDGEEDKIAKLVTLQRGILTAQVQHIRNKKLTITNRLREPATVFIRHTINKGWTIVAAPDSFERVGDAHLFQIQLKPHEVKTVLISEATPVERTLDLNADVTLGMMKVFVETADGSPELKEQLRKLLGNHKSLIDLAQEQTSLRRRLGDYKERMDELHAQILTLQAVKTGNDLMSHLKTKMRDISNRVQKTTIDLVDSEEKIMLARVRFQDALAELTLPDATAPTTAGAGAAAAAKSKP
ncbi:MAG: OmpA family protein [Deltaproteobacteria bacterium]|nr:OmpA family protein [Deltaproteobacteria bacterium]